MSAFKTATVIWLWIMAVFEVVAIARVLVLHEPLEAVVPLYSVANAHSQSFVDAWLFIAATLAVVRASQALDVSSSSAWRITVLVHIVELVYHGFNSIVTERAFDSEFVPPAIILAGVIINAIWFAAAWWLLPSGPLVKGRRSE